MKQLIGTAIILLFSAFYSNAYACQYCTGIYAAEFMTGIDNEDERQANIEWLYSRSGSIAEVKLTDTNNLSIISTSVDGAEINASESPDEVKSAKETFIENTLKLKTTLSTNCVTLGESVYVSVNLVNIGTSDFKIDPRDLTVWLSALDSQGTPIKGLPFTDMICDPGNPPQLVIPAGMSECIRYNGVHPKTGRWRGFGTSGTHEGAGLVVNHETGQTCFPLTTIPGDYFLQYHVMIRSSEEGSESPTELVSNVVKLSIQPPITNADE